MVPNESPTAALSHGRKQSFVQVIITSVGKRRRGCSGNPPVESTLYWKRRINALWVCTLSIAKSRVVRGLSIWSLRVPQRQGVPA